MADVNEQIAAVKANSTTFTNASIRQVQFGFVVTGQIQYQDKATKGVLLTENAEGVASGPQQASTMALNYLTNGTFDATVDTAQPNLFAQPAQTNTI